MGNQIDEKEGTHNIIGIGEIECTLSDLAVRISGNLDDDCLREYHRLLSDLTKYKMDNKTKYVDISKESTLPISTVKRIFYSSSIPKVTTFLKVLNVMGLTLEIVPRK